MDWAGKEMSIDVEVAIEHEVERKMMKAERKKKVGMRKKRLQDRREKFYRKYRYIIDHNLMIPRVTVAPEG